MSVMDLVRPGIRTLHRYIPARTEASRGALRMLDTNESAWPPVGDNGLNCHRYPEPQPSALIGRLTALYGVRRDQLLVGRGIDEAIDWLVRTFCRAGQDAIVIQPPTFGMYAVSAHIQGAAVIEVPLEKNFTLNVAAVLAAVTHAVKLVFVCRPNNPVGQDVSRTDIETLVKALADRALVVVDEAYVEFADQASVVDLIDRYDNVAVLRTLSKAWALAGARIGSVITNAALIALMRRIIPLYPLPRPSIDAGLKMLSDLGKSQVHLNIDRVRTQRQIMREELVRVPGVRAVLPSQTNFLAVRFDAVDDARDRLQAAGIVVRDIRQYPRLQDALRITIGTSEDNACVLAALKCPPCNQAAFIETGS